MWDRIHILGGSISRPNGQAGYFCSGYLGINSSYVTIGFWEFSTQYLNQVCSVYNRDSNNASVCQDNHTSVDSTCIEVVQDELIMGVGFGYFLIEIKIIIQPALPQSRFILDVISKIDLGFKGLVLIIYNILLWALLWRDLTGFLLSHSWSIGSRV